MIMKTKITQAIASCRPVVIAFVMFSLLVSLSSACDLNSSGSSEDQFKTMEVNNKIAHFSFEYRTYYSDIDGPWVDDNKYRQITYMDILAPKKNIQAPNPEPEKAGKTVEMKYTPASIGITIGNALNRQFSPAQERISNALQSWSRWDNYKFIDRKSVMVSGIQGEMATYEVDGLIGPKLLYQSDVAFDYGGKEWDIHLEADVSLTDMVKEDFQHVIDTFKILN